ncbi:MAG: NADPH:quinone reductase [Mycobacteriales bacterium]
MRAVSYTQPGGPDVLQLTERPVPEPGPGEVRVRVAFSGVNPTDWKSRTNNQPGPDGQIPNQDGSGTVEAVGQGVDPVLIGERVWIWEAAWQRPFGTAAEYTVVPARQTVLLGAEPSFQLGAALGIPFLTAHRCLTVAEALPDRIGPGTLNGHTVLVQGGAGAVGNAAIQLARWAGATVLSTVSSPEKAALATAAGAQHVVNYREGDPAAAIRAAAPDGVDIVVEVAPGPNAALNHAVVGPDAVVAVYANSGADEVQLPVRPLLGPNTRYQFLLVYTVPDTAKRAAVEDVSAAVAAGALDVGEERGLPLHRYPLDRTAEAHDAVQSGAVGKVLITVT